MIKSITVVGGKDKEGQPEKVRQFKINTGDIIAIVGATGSGKSQLISDIEQWADGETPSERHILIDGEPAEEYTKQKSLRNLVAEVSQNMNFVIDMSVEDFLILHARSRNVQQPEVVAEKVINYANQLTGEPIYPQNKLTVLSGGQSRALMVADVGLISNAPVVLIDEIENAGIDRLGALKRLATEGKMVVLATHDPMLALMADRRVVMRNGGITKVLTTSQDEKRLLSKLIQVDQGMSLLREQLRNGLQVGEELYKQRREGLMCECNCKCICKDI